MGILSVCQILNLFFLRLYIHFLNILNKIWIKQCVCFLHYLWSEELRWGMNAAGCERPLKDNLRVSWDWQDRKVQPKATRLGAELQVLYRHFKVCFLIYRLCTDGQNMQQHKVSKKWTVVYSNNLLLSKWGGLCQCLVCVHTHTHGVKLHLTAVRHSHVYLGWWGHT